MAFKMTGAPYKNNPTGDYKYTDPSPEQQADWSAKGLNYNPQASKIASNKSGKDTYRFTKD